MAVTTVLTALLMPALSKLHENVNLVRCANNLKQIGTGTFMYAEDWRGNMPPTIKLHPNPDVSIEPQELMASYHTGDHVQAGGSGSDGAGSPTTAQALAHNQRYGVIPLPEHLKGWDGLGLLHVMEYCRAVECYYCPSHTGEHPIDRYADDWKSPQSEPIYINYHYAGHIDWDTRRRRSFRLSPDFVIASDGLRTTSDFNHGRGMNILFGDASVEWRGSALAIYELLPEDALPGSMQEDVYRNIWMELDKANSMNWHGGDE